MGVQESGFEGMGIVADALNAITDTVPVYVPGMRVMCRGREWIVQDGSTQDDLYLKPVDGDGYIARVYVPLEFEIPEPI